MNTKSQYRIIFWVVGIVGFISATLLFLMPLPESSDPSIPHLDKIFHFLIHFSLTSYFSCLVKKSKAFMFFAIYGISIEFAQQLSGFRSYEALDIVFNLCGDFVGYLIGWKILGSQLKRYL